MNKKGNFQTTFLIVIIAFAMVLVSLLAIKVMNVVNTQFQANDQVGTEAKQTLSTMTNRLPKWIDGAFLFFWIVFLIVGIVLSFQIQTSPIYLPISIFYFVILIGISRIFGVIYDRLVTSSVLATENAALTIIPYIMPRLHILSFLFGALLVGIMILKR